MIWFLWRWTWLGLTLLLRISQWRIKDHVILEKISLFENVDIFIFLKFYIFFIFDLLENVCRTTRAVGQSLKEKRNYFWCFWKWVSHGASNQTHTKWERKLFLVFLKMSITRGGRPSKHNKEKENIFYFL